MGAGARRRASPRPSRAAPEKRTTAALAIEHLAAHAPDAAAVDRAARGSPFGGIEINRDTCTMCLACVGSCPEAAITDNIERPQVRFIESEVRAVRHLRGDVPRARDHARAAARPHARRARAARAERSRDRHLHPMRQAPGHAEDDRDDAGQARGPFDVRGAGRARSPAACAPTAASSTSSRTRTASTSAKLMNGPGLSRRDAARAGAGRPGTRRVLRAAGSALMAPPDAPLLAPLGASELWADDGAIPLRAHGTGWCSRAAPWTPTRPSRSTPTFSSASGRRSQPARVVLDDARCGRPLVAVRDGLARSASRAAGVATSTRTSSAPSCETMRILVAGHAERRPAPSPISASFSSARCEVGRSMLRRNNAIVRLPTTTVRVAEFTSLFLAVERDSLAIE